MMNRSGVKSLYAWAGAVMLMVLGHSSLSCAEGLGGFTNQAFLNNQLGQFGNGAKTIAGFSKLLKLGNQTLGQLVTGEQIALQVDGNGNLVDQTGRRVAARDPDIARQFQSFALLNRDKLQGNQRNAVDRFLLASGGISDGRMTIDLAAFSLRPRGAGPAGAEQSDLPPGVNRIKAGLAALNFLLNSLQNQCLIRIFENQVDYASGTLTMDFSSFRDQNGNQCLSGLTLSLMEAADEKDRCNGGKIRINELINTMMQPNFYAAAQGFSGLNQSEIADRFGVNVSKFATFGNKLLVGTQVGDGKDQSNVVGGPQRVLERQNTLNVPGRFCYRSLDFKDVHEGGAGTTSRSVEESGILFTHEAEEWLCIGTNGFLVTFLFNADGTLLDEAPASVASSYKNLRPAVRNGASCLDCHHTGFLGGSSTYEEQKQKIRLLNQPTEVRGPDGRRLTHGDFFTTNQPYYAQGQQDSNVFVQSQIASGSYLPDPANQGKPIPLIPESMHVWNDPVTEAVMARELGVSPVIARSILGGRAAIPRLDFES
ncbi:MAG: hypothetical protein ACKN9V_06485, partial [Pseudomonadota bacterium]